MSTVMLSLQAASLSVKAKGPANLPSVERPQIFFRTRSATASINAVVHPCCNRSVNPSVPGLSSAVITSINALRDSSVCRRRSIFSIA